MRCCGGGGTWGLVGAVVRCNWCVARGPFRWKNHAPALRLLLTPSDFTPPGLSDPPLLLEDRFNTTV